MWSLLSATVGLIFRLLDGAAEKMGGAGEIILKIVRSIAQMAWGIITIFVIPAMVYNDLSPFKAIKKLAQTIKKTWGELIIRYFSMGLMKFLSGLLGFLIGAGLVYLMYVLESTMGIIIVIISVIVYWLVLGLIFSAAEKVYNTALYSYADKGKVPKGYTKETLKDGFKVKA